MWKLHRITVRRIKDAWKLFARIKKLFTTREVSRKGVLASDLAIGQQAAKSSRG